MPDELPELIVSDAAAWRAWLRENHADPAAVWLVLAKKGTEEPTSITYDQALEPDPKALPMFDTLNSQNRYAILYRIATAKRADLRARRIEQFVAMLARGETVHPQKSTQPG